MKTPRLENWAIVFHPVDLYLAPELRAQHLNGEVFGHPDHADGKIVTTSRILGYDPETNEVVCFSRRYKLGQISLDYEKTYPEAEKRFKESFSPKN